MSSLLNIFFDLINIPPIRFTAKKILGLIEFKKDICIHVGGFRIYSNTIDRLLASLMWKFESLEGYESQVLKDHLKKGMTIIDIGANIGYYTLLMGQITGPDGIVYAFEPEPNNFRLLSKNILKNNIQNIHPFQKAVSDKNGFIKLFISKEHRGDHKIFETDDKRPSITVDQISIDDFLKDKRKIDLIKMDIQGAEHLALEGLKHTIAENKDIIIITEFSPELLRESGGNPEDFLDNLISMGFKIRLIDEKNKILKPIDKNELIRICKGARYENLYLSRS